jgi:hypothetical protein
VEQEKQQSLKQFQEILNESVNDINMRAHHIEYDEELKQKMERAKRHME